MTIGSVLCCKCGIPMQPNVAGMCVKCLRSEVDITEGLPKRLLLRHCPECDSYLQPPLTWVRLQLESKELLTFCLKKLHKSFNSNNARMVHAEFIWTEPHSKRVKVKVKVQKEVLNGAILEQSYPVEYVLQDHMCEYCSKVQANPDQWVAAVQLRQHVSHRRTFFYLEQLILKHGAASTASRIKQMDQGIDFFFPNRSHGVKFVDFVGKVVPVRSHHNKQLVSHDTKSNNYNYKYTFSVEICPICREDLICLPPKVAVGLGNLGPLVICNKVTNSVALLDPFTLRHCFLNADQYWRSSFKSLLTSRQLVEYIVLDVELVSSEVTIGGKKYVLADAQVARVSDFGKNDTIFFTRTHLGHLLNPGDYALGYDLYGANNNDIEFDKYRGLVLPDAILIKKSYEDKCGKPKLLDMDVDDKGSSDDGSSGQDKVNSEYEQFLKDLEENPDLRFNMSLDQNREYQPSEIASATDSKELPYVPLEEVFADLDLSDEEDDSSIMENENGQNSEQPISNKNIRRTWSKTEDENFLTILEELVLAGHKGDNGTFENVTHEEALKRMKSIFPEISLDVKQVVIKMKSWFTKFNEVVALMNTSGFSWDDTRKCVTVDTNKVLSDYLKKHPKAGNHVNKEFKEFERLQCIFGKDCAKGIVTETTIKAVERENGETQVGADDCLQHNNSPTFVENNSMEPPIKRHRSCSNCL
ncbi:hypothetical protein OROGR_017265 [Orobanche gracilis]